MAKEANKHNLRHKRNIARYEGKIDKLYKDAIQDIVQMSRLIGQIDDSKPFDFADHPALRKRFQHLLKEFQEAMEVNIIDGIEAEWNLANGKNDELVKQVLGRKASKLPPEQQQRYFNNHDTALEAFKERTQGGMNLSERVWNYTKQFKGEMEMALDIGIGEGRSAVELSRDLRKYLKHPDMLFRRVRDKHGVLHLSQRAENYHPGRGVYRSSYKNARRLVATETNMAYRTADHLRWQDLDFVVGIKISLSNNHTLLGSDGKPHPFHDICDDLAGNYPKDFKFVGWHPHCRCFATPILKTLEEFQADNKRILNGEKVGDGSVNRVEDVPDNYKKWFDKNADRIEKAKKQGTLPFFLRDNVQYHKGENADRWDSVIQVLEKTNIAYHEVKTLKKALSESEIIARVGGGDLTGGSCSSLAFTYAGNKGGLDVLDFRDGNSREQFSTRSVIMKVTENVGGVIVEEFSDFTAMNNLLKHTKEGKEYYFACAEHAAIVRKTASGYEYLELQSATSNGFKPLSKDTLKMRFGAKRSRSHYGHKYKLTSCLIDIDLLNGSGGFKKMLGYINTNVKDQKKGIRGTIK